MDTDCALTFTICQLVVMEPSFDQDPSVLMKSLGSTDMGHLVILKGDLAQCNQDGYLSSLPLLESTLQQCSDHCYKAENSRWRAQTHDFP